MRNRIMQAVVANMCIMFSSTLIYASDNHLVNFLQNVANGTQNVAKGILHGTEKIFDHSAAEPPKQAKPVTVKKAAKPVTKVKKVKKAEKVEKKTTILAQQAPAPDANAQAPAPDANAQAPAPDANAQAPAPDANAQAPAPDANAQAPTSGGNMPPAGSDMSGGNTNIPEVAEPGVQVPNNQTTEPVQSNDTTTGITGGDSY